MPGVFGPLAEYFAAQPGNDVVFAAEYSRRSLELPGVRRLRVRKTRERRAVPASGGRREDAARELQRAFLRGDAMHESLLRLRDDGFEPDIIVTSSGMGVSMLTREVFPNNFLAAYLDWVAVPRDLCAGGTPYQRAVQLLTQSKLVVDADYLFTLSQGQWQQYPPFIADHIDILPPCVDTLFFSPAAARPFEHEGRVYSRAGEVLVFCAVGGFPQKCAAMGSHAHAADAASAGACLFAVRRAQCLVRAAAGLGSPAGMQPLADTSS